MELETAHISNRLVTLSKPFLALQSLLHAGMQAEKKKAGSGVRMKAILILIVDKYYFIYLPRCVEVVSPSPIEAGWTGHAPQGTVNQ